jgi:hypothetical protein
MSKVEMCVTVTVKDQYDWQSQGEGVLVLSGSSVSALRFIDVSAAVESLRKNAVEEYRQKKAELEKEKSES